MRYNSSPYPFLFIYFFDSFTSASLALSLFFYPAYYIHFVSLLIHFFTRLSRIASRALSLIFLSCLLPLFRFSSYSFVTTILSHRFARSFSHFSILLTTSISPLFSFICHCMSLALASLAPSLTFRPKTAIHSFAKKSILPKGKKANLQSNFQFINFNISQ